MSRMTDAEIIKNLECCTNDDEPNCKECTKRPHIYCMCELLEEALALIQRQQAEITLKTEYIQEQRDVIAELKGKIESFADRIVEQLKEAAFVDFEEEYVDNGECLVYLQEAIAIVKGVQNEQLE